MTTTTTTTPLLCVITRAEGRGGIARVAWLLGLALDEYSAGRCRTIELLPNGAPRATGAAIARFGLAVAGSQVAGADWVMFDHLGPARVQSMIPPPMRRPYAVFLHGTEAWCPLDASRLRVLRRATVRIANSIYTRNRVLETHPDAGPIDVCHLALPPDQVAAALAPDLDLLGRVMPGCVLIVGRMESSERHKGHDRLIAGWPAVVSEVPGAQLVVVGTGDDLERLRGAARSAGCGDNILFVGSVDEGTLHALYQKATVFAMPSRSEGFGLVYLEAMAHRLPVIASTSDAAGEIVEHERTGLLVSQDDVPALAASIVRLLRDPAARIAMGEAGFRRLEAEFSYRQFYRRYTTAVAPMCGTTKRP